VAQPGTLKDPGLDLDGLCGLPSESNPSGSGETVVPLTIGLAPISRAGCPLAARFRKRRGLPRRSTPSRRAPQGPLLASSPSGPRSPACRTARPPRSVRDPTSAMVLASVVRDRERPDLGSGRLMAKLRAIEIPRFDADWNRHLEIVREIVATVQRHEAAIKGLNLAIEIAEAAIDHEVYALFGLDDADVVRRLAFQPRSDE